MNNSPSRNKKMRGGKIDFHGYIPPDMYDQIAAFKDPDAGDRWESALLRRIIREWLLLKKSEGPSGAGTQREEGKEKLEDEGGGYHHSPMAKRGRLVDGPKAGKDMIRGNRQGRP